MDYTGTRHIKENIDGYDCRLILRKPGDKPLIAIGLNPSKADESASDATMRKLMGFMSRWEQDRTVDFDSFIMLNLYPLIETSPSVMKETHSFNHKIHNRNMEMLASILDANRTADVLLCYGDSIELASWMKDCRDSVLGLLSQYPDITLYCLGALTKRKNPRHPCRLAYKTKLTKLIINGGTVEQRGI